MNLAASVQSPVPLQKSNSLYRFPGVQKMHLASVVFWGAA